MLAASKFFHVIIFNAGASVVLSCKIQDCRGKLVAHVILNSFEVVNYNT